MARFLANKINVNFEKSVDFLNAADTDFVSDLIAKLKFEVYLQADEIIREGSGRFSNWCFKMALSANQIKAADRRCRS